ncbi:hypothetical protein pb186bvf_006034 [Paramecium bursaria]
MIINNLESNKLIGNKMKFTTLNPNTLLITMEYSFSSLFQILDIQKIIYIRR